jgi:RimJ/RimL family protein N-acetyltransferase
MENVAASLMQLSEVEVVVDYFHDASPEFLHGLGVDKAKLPPRKSWFAHYESEFALPIEKRKSLLVLWRLNDEPIGFSTADKIKFGEEAYMHLHIVRPDKRRAGMGTEFVRQTARIYFNELKIQRLFCEPYALNEAPNRTLARAGFAFVKTYETVPGPLNFHQPVKRWLLNRPA